MLRLYDPEGKTAAASAICHTLRVRWRSLRRVDRPTHPRDLLTFGERVALVQSRRWPIPSSWLVEIGGKEGSR
jgi:hypothetical protein